MFEVNFSLFKIEFSLGGIHFHKHVLPEAVPAPQLPKREPPKTITVGKPASGTQLPAGRVNPVPPEMRHIIGSASEFNYISLPDGCVEMIWDSSGNPVVYLRADDPYPNKMIQIGTRKWSDGTAKPYMAEVRRKPG